MIQVEGLHFRYRPAEEVLRGVNLSVAPGEYVLLVGPSGSGKSTLLRCLNGLIPHFHRGEMTGRVTVADRDVSVNPPAAMFDRVALLPQNPAGALFTSTVEDEIAFGLESLGVPAAEIPPRVKAAARSVGLANRLDRPPHTLSGGQQQRLLVASALAVQPSVLVLDEPFAHLDPEMREELLVVLKRLAAAGVTVVVAEHRIGSVVSDVDRLVVMEEGTIVRDGSPAEVLSEDLRRFGVNLPLPVQVGHELGIRPVPTTLAALAARLPPDAVLPAAEPARWSRSDGPVVVELDSVSLAYGGALVMPDFSAVIHAGEVVALLGRNGAGKTTLLKHLNGLRRSETGTIRILGRNVRGRSVSELAHDVGFVFQNPNDQFFCPSVRDELEVGPRALGAYDAVWIDELVERFGLGPLLERSPFTLSEGQKKRVTFAAALATRPTVVLLDEPASGQDEHFRRALVELIRQLADEGRTTILATHDVGLADETASRWLVLGRDHLLADGAPAAVMSDVEAFHDAGLRPGGMSWLRALLPVARTAP